MFYLSSIGIMMAIYTVNGFDSAGQLSGETNDPEINSPKAIIKSLVASYTVSTLFLFSFLYNLGGSSDDYIHKLCNSSNALM